MSGQSMLHWSKLFRSILGEKKKMKLQPVIPLQGNPYTVICFIAKLFLCETMPEV